MRQKTRTSLHLEPLLILVSCVCLALTAAGCIESNPYRDADGDGYLTRDSGEGGTPDPVGDGEICGETLCDCNDHDNTIHPGATELCDGIDNNCDAALDENVTIAFYPDLDSDGYGDAAGTAIQACSATLLQAPSNDDCDDTLNNIHPDAEEVCDSQDNDCDTEIDESLTLLVYPDLDDDGYGASASTPIEACAPDTLQSLTDNDCDDAEESVHPDADEVCNTIDNDCDNEIDEGVLITCYLDLDEDGFGDDSKSSIACECPSNSVENGGDCNDSNASLNPAVSEVCDVIDNDCDGVIDDDFVYLNTFEFVDEDLDGFGVDSSDRATCVTRNTYESQVVSLRGDCNDSDESVYPGAADGVGDDIDSDCGGRDGQQPSVGFDITLDAMTTNPIQAAIDRAQEGDIVWILQPEDSNGYRIELPSEPCYPFGSDPGTGLKSRLCIHEKRIALKSVGLGGASVVLQPESPVKEVAMVTFSAASCLSSVPLGPANCPLIDGFLIRGGTASGLHVRGSEVWIENMKIEDNSGTNGGGILLKDSSASISNSQVRSNTVDESGGGINFQVGENVPNDVIPGQTYYLTLYGTPFTDNRAAFGGGVSVVSSNSNPIEVSMEHCLFLNNEAQNSGGAINLVGVSSGSITSHLTQMTVVGNRANEPGSALAGGGINVHGFKVGVTLTNSILAHNIGYNFFMGNANPDIIQVENSILFGIQYTSSLKEGCSDAKSPGNCRVEGSNHDLDPAQLKSVFDLDPMFLRYRNDRISSGDNLHLLPSSPAVGLDLEWGCYDTFGDPTGYYRDVDQDGLYDGWERVNYGDITQGSGTDDKDGDGLDTRTEFLQGLDPNLADTDEDGETDGAEWDDCSDPRDWYSRRAGAFAAVMQPDDTNPNLMAYIDRISTSATLSLPAGKYKERLSIGGKCVTLRGETSDTTLSPPDTTNISLITSTSSHMTLERLTVQGSVDQGIRAFLGELMLADLKVVDNGPKYDVQTGIYAYCEGLGGGIMLSNVDNAGVFDSVVSFNRACGKTRVGGGLMVEDSGLVTISNVRVEGNEADQGAGMWISGTTSVLLQNVLLNENLIRTPEGSGAALYVTSGSAVTLDHVVAHSNVVSSGVGGIFVAAGNSLGLSYSVIANNAGCNILFTDDEDLCHFQSSFDVGNQATTQEDCIDEDLADGLLPAFVDAVSGDFHLAGPVGVDVALPTSGTICGTKVSPDLLVDPDASAPDQGIFGGPEGGSWDLDEDGFFDYFWPGSIDDVPPGFDSADWDCDDTDAAVHACL